MEAATGSGLWKKVFLKISHISKENTCAGFSFNKVVDVKAGNFTEISKIYKNAFFGDQQQTTASSLSNTGNL